MLIKMNKPGPDICLFIYTLVLTGARKNDIRPLARDRGILQPALSGYMRPNMVSIVM